MNDVAHDNVTVPSVLVIGGGFAGVGCATELAKHDVHVTLIDRNNYHQFQPLLYQVATGELAASDVARPLRDVFANRPTVTVLQAEIDAVDVDQLSVTTTGGQTHSADYLVLAAGSVPNYFGVPGADEHAFALYSVADAKRLRSRLFECFEDAAENPARIDEGALNIVIVGAGPTGVETAGAVADLVNEVMPDRYRNLDLTRASIRLVDHGPVVLGAFSDKAHRYAARKLEELGVELLLQRGVKEVRADRVVLDDDSEILTRAVVWAGGTKPPALTANTGLPTGRGGRLDALADLTADGHPRVYPIGDMANTIDRDGDEPAGTGVGGIAGRAMGGPQHRRRHPRQGTQAVPVPRQGDHGDDQPRLGRRRGRSPPPRTPRGGGLLRLARRACLADERDPPTGRRVRVVGMGLPRIEPGRRPDRP